MSEVVFVDTECIGLHPDNHAIWEVALVKQDGTELTWMLPVDPSKGDPIGMSIGRFHERHPYGNTWGGEPTTVEGLLERPGLFARQFAKLTHGAHLAGAVISFDEERLRRLLLANGVQPSWHYHTICVEVLAVGYLQGRRSHLKEPAMTPPWDSEDLSRAVGVDPDKFDRHTALGDALWAAEIYRAVMG
jgi:DNA polymerase III epsilon subunit-like protein